MDHQAKQIWIGPLLGDNRARLIDECAQVSASRSSRSFLYLAASQPLLDVASERILASNAGKGIWGELPVYLFRGFVRRILNTTVDSETRSVLAPRIPIDRDELPLKRSLISQILQVLKSEGKLKAIAALANSDGCVNTISTLIGEIQRAGKSPSELQEILNQRAAEFAIMTNSSPRSAAAPYLQTDFDREVALIYSTYASLLQRNNLSEDDADGLRVLEILRGELDGRAVEVPWLDRVELLVLDGFFDFTPAQGEMLRALIPRFPRVLVNLNKDERNPEIFKPFDETLEGLCSMADFKIHYNDESAAVQGSLSSLRQRLFNPSVSLQSLDEEADGLQQNEIRYFDCTDRETEVRAIAKEIKRLVLLNEFKLSEVALVVRERESYAETIIRVMREEGVPCNLDRRTTAAEIPAARAVLKLLAVLDDLAREGSGVLKMPDLADQIKSGYFRLSQDEIETLTEEFLSLHRSLLDDKYSADEQGLKRLRRDLGIGRWDADVLENIIAYVGAELRLDKWLERCRNLVEQLPSAEATRELLNIDTSESINDDPEAQLQDAETVQKEDKKLEKKGRPQRDVHPASLAWAALVIKRFAAAIQEVPAKGQPGELRGALLKLLRRFQFRNQVTKPVRSTDDEQLTRTTLDLHALEALRRALLTTVKSIQLTRTLETPAPLTTFIEEMRRCLSFQRVTIGSAERGGLRVLEATNVRGLRFRALFVAGLVEGGFPLSTTSDWIYPHEERERLKQYGLVLEDISPNTLLKEEHYFYQVACRATERLYLSRPLLLEGDTQTVTSYYVDELRRAIAPAILKTEEVVRPDYDGSQLESVSSNRELAISLIRLEQHHVNGVDRVGAISQSQVRRLLSLARNDELVSESALYRTAIERERSGASFGPYDGQVTDPHLLALVKKRFGPDFMHSASGLSTFGNCPYRFFGLRVLKLEPRGEAALDLQALDAGRLLHDILRRFFERHRNEELDDSKQEELTRELLDIADDVFDQHQRVVPPLNRQIWKLDRAIRKIILEQVLLFELDVQKKSAGYGVRPAHFELAFGRTQSVAKDPHSIDQPLRLTRKRFVEEETIEISGQIDRVDIAADKTIIAYDYKLSKGASREDISSGRSLQIPIYLAALEQLFFPERQTAGGGYYTLRGGTDRRNRGVYREAFNGYLNLNPNITSLFEESEWELFRSEAIERIWQFLDRMRNGQFLVDPSEGKASCRFCDYAAVCRYDKYRIERKKRSQGLAP